VLEGELVIDSMEFNPRLSMSGSEDFQKLADSLEGEVSSSKCKLKVIKSWAFNHTNSEEKFNILRLWRQKLPPKH
jgi:hypothetical protein